MRQINVKTVFLRTLIAAIAVANNACSSGSGSTTTKDSLIDDNVTLKSRIYFDNVTQIPLNGTNRQYILRINNSYDKSFLLSNIKVINPKTGNEDKSLADVNQVLCSTIAAKNSCSINIVPHATQSSSFILQAELKGSDGEQQTIKQFIRVSDKISDTNGIMFDNDLTIVNAQDNNYNIALPVVLSKEFDEIKARNGQLICNGGFKPGVACTYLVSGNISADNTLVATTLEGYKNGKLVASRSYTTKAIRDGRANLLISQPNDIKIKKEDTKGETSLFIYNNGLVSASELKETLSSNLKLENNCSKGSLVPGDTCEITLSSDSTINQVGNFSLSYNNGMNTENTDSVTANVLIFKEGNQAKLEVTGLTGLTNAIVGFSVSNQLTLTNSGDFALENISYGLDNTKEFTVAELNNDDSSCKLENNQITSLAPGKACKLQLTYTPQEAIAKTQLNLTFRADYTDVQNRKANYLATYIADYSATNLDDIAVISLNKKAMTLIAGMNAGEEAADTLEIKNHSSYLVTLDALKFLEGSAEGLTIGEATQDNVGNKCNTSLNINKGTSCKFLVKYEPKKKAPSRDQNLTVKVNKLDNKDTNSKIKDQVKVTTTIVDKLSRSNIEVGIIATDGMNNVDLDPEKSIDFYAIPGNSLKVTYTFTAKDGPALAFNVATTNLPILAKVKEKDTDTECPNGSSIGALEKDQSCTLVVNLPRQELLDSGLLNGLVGEQKLVLPYSWQDRDDKGKTALSKENTKELKLNLKTSWLDGLTVTPNPFTLDKAGKLTSKIAVSFEELKGIKDIPTELKVTAEIPGNDNSAASCNINVNKDKTCTLDLSIPASSPKGDYRVFVKIADTTVNSKLVYTTVTTAKYGEQVIENEYVVTEEDAKEKEIAVNQNGVLTTYRKLIIDNETLVIPSKVAGTEVTAIGKELFKEKTNFTSVKIPSTVKSIGEKAFESSSLQTLVIPEGVTEIKPSAFYSNQLKSVKIASTVTSIGEKAFLDNEIEEITIPKKVESIGFSAFSHNKLKHLVFEDGSKIELLNSDSFSYNQLSKLSIPASLKSIGNHAFLNNPLERLYIPKGSELEYIGEYSFPGYIDESGNFIAKLKTIQLPSSVTTIAKRAFKNQQLENLVIPPSVTHIQAEAFDRANNVYICRDESKVEQNQYSNSISSLVLDKGAFAEDASIKYLDNKDTQENCAKYLNSLRINQI